MPPWGRQAQGYRREGVANVRDFVVWGLPPIGAVDPEKAEWLVSVLSDRGLTKSGRLIAREVARDAEPALRCLT